MRIGFTYDVPEDYALDSTDHTHADFSTFESILYNKKLLEQKGHLVTLIGNFDKLCAFIKDGGVDSIDIIFNAAEGLNNRNREGYIPSLLDGLHIPYVGTDAYGLGVCLNKLHTKILGSHLGVPTARYSQIVSENDIPLALRAVGVPCVLKPNYEGTSSGVVLVENENSFRRAASSLLSKYRQMLLCEEYIEGIEVVVPIIGSGKSSCVIGIVEIVRRNGEPIKIFSVEDKLLATCQKQIPNLEENVRKKITEYSLLLHDFIGCYDYNRVDFRIKPNGDIRFLEMNALPDLGEHSGFMRGCTLYGLEPADVLDKIVKSAAARWAVFA